MSDDAAPRTLSAPEDLLPDPHRRVDDARFDRLRESVLGHDLDAGSSHHRRRAEHVLLVVLESTRWDYWGEPELTPRFHEWRTRGTYLPGAVAQYPATPLAYGALFTSQPPTVLAASPHWAEHRPFDALVDAFDEIYLSQPANLWFEHGAITDFWQGGSTGAAAHRHESTPAALEYLRDRLSVAARASSSFFAWAHLYEPHAPYQLREPYLDRARIDDSERRTAYRSELAYIDDHLGRFMEWFHEQPFADEALVIVMGDHGQGTGDLIYGEPFWGHHVHVHDLVAHVPACISGPGVPADRLDAGATFSQLDVLPTIFDLLGVAPPDELPLQGVPLTRLLEARPGRSIPTEAFGLRGMPFFEYIRRLPGLGGEEALDAYLARCVRGGDPTPKIALERGDRRLHFDRHSAALRLYDIALDPAEERDIAHDDPRVLEAALEYLRDWTELQGAYLARAYAL